MRNGDFIPSRLQAQQDAVSLICHSKIRSNIENNVGLITLSNNPQVLATMTMDVGRILSKLHQVQPEGQINFMTGIKIAHLALKHKQGKNHKMRIVVFVGSPLELDEKELDRQAKRLKKEKVNVDIINFGEETKNTEKLNNFIGILNGKEGTGSHLVTVPPGPLLSEALISSPVIQGEDGQGAVGLGGSGYEFGIDPNEDPELALALRVSMEEQRQRQEEDARRTNTETGGEASASVPSTTGSATAASSAVSSEEALLEQALAMSLEGNPASASTGTVEPISAPDFAAMTEDEQVAYALQMSLAQAQDEKPDVSPVPMETDEKEEKPDKSKP
jgi:26S proteasome regulatory subunit N10